MEVKSSLGSNCPVATFGMNEVLTNAYLRVNTFYVDTLGRTFSIALREDTEDIVLILATVDKPFEQEIVAALHAYFRFEFDLELMVEKWCTSCNRFKSILARNQALSYIRLVKQDPIECIFGFICSQNNNISRIKQLVMKLKLLFGTKMETFVHGTDLYSFPSIEGLVCKENILLLRQEKFGYRAEYIVNTARKLHSMGMREPKDFALLYKMSSEKAIEFLLELPGIGPKVADCIALMSLGYLNIVPIDTHMYNYAKKNFLTLKTVTLSTKNRRFIQRAFSDKFGEHAGWAHLVSKLSLTHNLDHLCRVDW